MNSDNEEKKMLCYRERILKSGLKKKWIAKRIGISHVLFSYYLNNTRPMPDHIENKLKEILG